MKSFLLNIHLNDKGDLFFLLIVAVAFFVFGMFFGKNNDAAVQKLGEQAEKTAGEVAAEVKDQIQKK